MAEQQFKRVDMIYIGVRISTDKKRVYAWVEVDDRDHVVCYNKQIIAGSAAVGNIYETWQSTDSIKTGGDQQPKYLRRHEDDADILEWSIKDESAKQQLAVKSMNAKAAKVSPLDDELDKIRRMAAPLNATERSALIAKLSRIIILA
jgi:hypothetical protein